MYSLKSQQGFTLLEVMIVAVVVAILASIAYPSYRDSVLKARRAEGKAAIVRNMQAQERYYSTYNTYLAFSSGSPPPAGSGFSTFSGDTAAKSAYGAIAAAACASSTLAQCVTITATVTPADPKCGATLSMDSIGNKLPTTAGCW